MNTRRVAMITGGLHGIGKSITTKFAALGYDLAVHARKVSTEQRVWLDALADKSGVRAIILQADFIDQNSIKPMFDEFAKNYTRLDVLINNAGFENCHSAEFMPIKDWNEVLQVNLTAPFQCSQLAAQIMKNNGGGAIVNMTSIHDDVPRKGLSHYCCSKAALHMLTKTTALEWAEYGIRVNSLGAGAIETDMNHEALDSFGREKFHNWIPAGRIGNVEEVAQLAAYLCSEGASYITGIDVYIDGGYKLNTIRYDDRPEKRDLAV
jgi:NAD(P)-dependent dehydrogenase (short-subunit alcohol dehydrogenase family)